MKPIILITRKLPDAAIKDLKNQYHIDMWEEEDVPIPREILLEKSKNVDALLTMITEKIDEELIANAKQLKVIANCAVGYDNVDVETATKYGVAVCNTPDVLTDTTADLTFALLMVTARRMIEAEKYIQNGQWKSWSPFLLAGKDIHHKTLGIVGMGKIGSKVAKRAKGFDMNILYHNRTRKIEVEEEIGAKYCSFEELLRTADFVVCLAPLTPETEGMFQKEQFNMMKKDAIFINVGRGPIVNEQDLYEAVKNGVIGGAGLDVFEKEPIDETHPLLTLPNVVALPHIGSSSVETRMRMIQLSCSNIDQILKEKIPHTLVNKQIML
ncbi:glyoxylate reductase [Oikeobacillus pervagus]|uniref:Glyoxylate reductase n=1 Tax=Oikeobacillus pervagus TaxID=1325931 RepID=A0AAJ1T0Z9_9BACI|nr:D-glycerate dehydrogenase [Oikeobacillus pervagus]MDQ0215172.1 glyoxylate reductase [Oikeobacillus pervagus]